MRLFDDDTQSVNDAAIVKLPAGKNVLKITGMKLRQAKKSQESMVVMNCNDAAGKRYTHFFMIAHENADTRRMAKQAIKGTWNACGLSGVPTEEMLPNFIGKFVQFDIEHTEPDDQGRFFINFNRIDPATGFGESTPATQYHQPEDKSDTIPMQYATDPAPAASPPAPSGGKDWRSLMKGRETPAPAPDADPAPF